MKFTELPLAPELLTTLNDLGFAEMTPIQEKTIPLLLEGKDLLGQSKTGSGKTAAFALPILQRLLLDEREVQALILCPTRELSAQVAREVRRLGRSYPGMQVAVLTGGASARDQVKSLTNGAQIIVGTPGRVLDLLLKNKLDLSQMRTLVLDEADKMLDMGFEEEMTEILNLVPKGRQTLFFSATFPESIQTLSESFQIDAEVVKIDGGDQISNSIYQVAFDMGTDSKKDLVLRVLQQYPSKATLIFCNQKTTVDELEKLIRADNVPVASLHGDFEQRERDRVLAMFRNGSFRILVATDVAARGLDIDHLELVINYDFPLSPDTYVHRIGRTGRAGRSGTAVLFTKADDALKVAELEKAAGQPLDRPRLGFKNQHGLSEDAFAAEMQTLWISGGRKDKLRPGDILGALTGSGGLRADHVGKIEVHDHFTYVGIRVDVAKMALARLRDNRIKAQKFQVRLMK